MDIPYNNKPNQLCEWMDGSPQNQGLSVCCMTNTLGKNQERDNIWYLYLWSRSKHCLKQQTAQRARLGSRQVIGTHFPQASAGVQPSILCDLSRLAGSQVKLQVNPSPDCSPPVRNTPHPHPSLHTASLAARAKNTRLQPSEGCSSFYGQRRLADHCWSLTPPPSTDQGPLTAWKTVWWLQVTGRWQRPDRGAAGQ